MANKRQKSFRFKRLFSNFLTVAMVLASVYLVSSSVTEWTQNYKSKQELTQLQAELDSLGQETVELEGFGRFFNEKDI